MTLLLYLFGMKIRLIHQVLFASIFFLIVAPALNHSAFSASAAMHSMDSMMMESDCGNTCLPDESDNDCAKHCYELVYHTSFSEGVLAPTFSVATQIETLEHYQIFSDRKFASTKTLPLKPNNILSTQKRE